MGKNVMLVPPASIQQIYPTDSATMTLFLTLLGESLILKGKKSNILKHL